MIPPVKLFGFSKFFDGRCCMYSNVQYRLVLNLLRDGKKHAMLLYTP